MRLKSRMSGGLLLLTIITAVTVLPAPAGSPLGANTTLVWQNIGFGSNRVGPVAVDPHNPLCLYVGLIGQGSSADDGLWRSVDGGTTWFKILADGCGACSVDPRNSSSIVAVGRAMYTTDNGGATWQFRMATPDYYMYNLVRDRLNANVLYAYGYGGRIYKSTNNGVNWNNVSPAGWWSPVDDLVIDPNNSNVLWATDGMTFVKSTTGGSGWSPVSSPSLPDVPAGIEVNPANSNNMFVTVNYKGVYRSDNGGAGWSLVSHGLPSGPALSDIFMQPNNPNVLVVGSGATCYATLDGGLNWTEYGSGLVTNRDTDKFSADPSNSNIVYATGYGGPYLGSWLTSPPPTTWYLAEGTTAWGFSTYISIENPNTTPVTCRVTYMTPEGVIPGPDQYMPAMSRATIEPAGTLGESDFSTMVQCLEGKDICVDRTTSWYARPGGEAHSSVGVTAPATQWYLPEGSTNWGFECWLLIQNPNAAPANCIVTYMIEGEGPVPVGKVIPPNSRQTFNIAQDIGSKDASIEVTSDIPVIPERAMYRNGKTEGHDSIGTTTPASNFYLAEGSTAWGFTTYVLVQNPNPEPCVVNVSYMTASGEQPQPEFTMPASSRKTIRVNDALPNQDFSTKVNGSKPIIAERAMYWNTAAGESCHDSIGMSAPHKTFYLPDGDTINATEARQGDETWTLVQNPNTVDVDVEISYLTTTGAGNVVWTERIAANSRKTFNMADRLSNQQAAIMVTCQTSGKAIMVERAMYWNSRAAGTDTIGGFSD